MLPTLKPATAPKQAPAHRSCAKPLLITLGIVIPCGVALGLLLGLKPHIANMATLALPVLFAIAGLATWIIAWCQPRWTAYAALVLVLPFFMRFISGDIRMDCYWPGRLFVPAAAWSMYALNTAWWIVTAWASWRGLRARYPDGSLSALLQGLTKEGDSGESGSKFLNWLWSGLGFCLLSYWLLVYVDDNLRGIAYLLPTQVSVVEARVMDVGTYRQQRSIYGRGGGQFVRYWDLQLPGSVPAWRYLIMDMGYREEQTNPISVPYDARRPPCYAQDSTQPGDVVLIQGRTNALGFAPDRVLAVRREGKALCSRHQE